MHTTKNCSKITTPQQPLRRMQLQDLNKQELYTLLTLRLEQQKQDLTTEQRFSVTLDIHNIRYQLWLYGNDLINKGV